MSDLNKHFQPKNFSDKVALSFTKFLRLLADTFFKKRYGHRAVVLETVAAVPGMVAGMLMHLKSLRKMEDDKGWIKLLLEEAENERMHLMTFLQLKNPGPIFRFGVVCTQYIFTAGFFAAYLASPKFCHRYVTFVFNVNINFTLNFIFYQSCQLTFNLIFRFVGYLEEEAVKTYSHIIEEIDAGRLPMWKNLPAPDIAVQYWQLPDNHTMRDVILAVRADEAHHGVNRMHPQSSVLGRHHRRRDTAELDVQDSADPAGVGHHVARHGGSAAMSNRH